MSTLLKGEKLEKILEKVNKQGITAYYLAEKTGLNESGLNKIFRGEVKNPHNSTIDTLYDYLYGTKTIQKQEKSTITIGGYELNFSDVEKAIYEEKERFLREGGVLQLIVDVKASERFNQIIKEHNLKISYSVDN